MYACGSCKRSGRDTGAKCAYGLWGFSLVQTRLADAKERGSGNKWVLLFWRFLRLWGRQSHWQFLERLLQWDELACIPRAAGYSFGLCLWGICSTGAGPGLLSCAGAGVGPPKIHKPEACSWRFSWATTSCGQLLDSHGQVCAAGLRFDGEELFLLFLRPPNLFFFFFWVKPERFSFFTFLFRRRTASQAAIW